MDYFNALTNETFKAKKGDLTSASLAMELYAMSSFYSSG